MKNLYELITVRIAGVETFARPVEFEYDDKSQPVLVKKIVTTCPKCGSLNEYESNLDDNSVILSLKCSNCEKEVIDSNIIKVDKKIGLDKPSIVSLGEPDFIDPIKAGLFEFDEILAN
jgi:hypothetical protein